MDGFACTRRVHETNVAAAARTWLQVPEDLTPHTCKFMICSWFAFSASERWRSDDSEHEHYSDSGGKSGGQKEKLAYTMLAASLAGWNA